MLKNIVIKLRFLRGFLTLLGEEIKRGTFRSNFKSILKTKEIIEDMSWAELLEEKARKHPEKMFLHFEGEDFTFLQMNENANRVARFLKKIGGARGKGVALIMDNSPRFLDLFFGAQKLGMYIIPVNTSLRGESLFYILNHSEADFIVIDDTYLDVYLRVSENIEKNSRIILNNSEENRDSLSGDDILSISEAYKAADSSSPTPGKKRIFNRDDICLILYTSGTTGLPKGVVYRYGRTTVKLLSIVAHALYSGSDVLYTCLPLFHGNALFVTITIGMHKGTKVVLARKFSASRFWEDIRKHDITSFNTIGAMIPILMKQPAKESDNKNNARFTISAACPADLWPKFEKRFGTKIYEAYGAIDGGGKSIFNLGNAPTGSIGRPGPGVRYRLVDNDGNDVTDGTPGELIFESSKKKKSVEYFKDEKASRRKLRNGWIYTGDLMKKDKKGYLYFVGRNAEFMRIKGENVSAYEVEHAIMKHPSILEAAVYAVPSELAEDEIMASISIVEGHTLLEHELLEYLKENLPKFAIPRYVKILPGFPKTETQRIIKKELEQAGVVSGTYDFGIKEKVGDPL
jgi:crotonobetaine/carnitine-CoA ligase